MLSDVLVEYVDHVTVGDPFEASSWTDGAELAVVADHDHLGSRQVSGGQQSEEIVVVRHSRLVEDHHGRLVES